MNSNCCEIPLVSGLRYALLPFLLVAWSNPVRAFKKDGLNIYVRSVVDSPVPGKVAHADRPKIYLLAPVRQLPSAMKLAKPVDPSVIEKASRKVLQKKGYQPAMEGDHPDEVIMVFYGRGFLSNPYLQGPGYGNDTVGDVPGMDPETHPDVPADAMQGSRTAAPTQVILFPTVDNFGPVAAMDERKRQFANFEKLVLIVSAFDFDAMQKHRTKRLWRTVVYIDDPDHRDLNQITKQLLDAAADYFGRKSEGKEVVITKPLPEGYVEVGRERVIEQPASIPDETK